MASEHDSPTRPDALFSAIIFGPLIMVGLLVLLAFWLAMLEAYSWLSRRIQEWRARRGIAHTRAPSTGNVMVENGMIEEP